MQSLNKKNETNSIFLSLLVLVTAAPSLILIGVIMDRIGHANASDLTHYLSEHVEFHGFIRQRVSLNMEDPIETKRDDQLDLSMMRSTFYLEGNARFDWVSFTAIARFDWEYMTKYLRRLEHMTTRHLKGEYDDYDLREFYADFNLFDERLFLRIGKQQVVWGKTDFFRGLDIIHGFDYRWRSFLEPENELLRKPLTLVNAEVQLPELKGVLQLIIRPGLDRKKDIGNTYDAFGGRWSNQPNKGINSLESMRYNLEHSEGDRDDLNYGMRWSGRAWGVEYSLNYLHTFNNDPLVNPSQAIGGDPFHEDPRNDFAEFIYPQVDIAGFTVNYYLASLDMIVRCEFSYTWEQPYNYGQQFQDGTLPGFAGIIEKDTIRSMLAFDKNVDWVKPLFGACRPGFLNIQIFDTWLMEFERHADIVAAAGYGAHLRRHSTILTAILSWNYNFDTINPTMAWGTDLRNGGGFVIPSVQFVRGDHWRLRIEYDWFYDNKGKKPGKIEHQARTFNFFDNNDQLYLRLTYQF